MLRTGYMALGTAWSDDFVAREQFKVSWHYVAGNGKHYGLQTMMGSSIKAATEVWRNTQGKRNNNFRVWYVLDGNLMWIVKSNQEEAGSK